MVNSLATIPLPVFIMRVNIGVSAHKVMQCVMLEVVVNMTKLKCPACDEVKCKGCQCRCHEIIRYYKEVCEAYEV